MMLQLSGRSLHIQPGKRTEDSYRFLTPVSLSLTHLHSLGSKLVLIAQCAVSTTTRFVLKILAALEHSWQSMAANHRLNRFNLKQSKQVFCHPGASLLGTAAKSERPLMWQVIQQPQQW